MLGKRCINYFRNLAHAYLAENCWKGVILFSNKIAIKLFGDFQTTSLSLKYLNILSPKREISRNREHGRGHQKFGERGGNEVIFNAIEYAWIFVKKRLLDVFLSAFCLSGFCPEFSKKRYPLSV